MGAPPAHCVSLPAQTNARAPSLGAGQSQPRMENLEELKHSPAEPWHKDLPALTASAAEGKVSWATAAQGMFSSQLYPEPERLKRALRTQRAITAS